MYEMTPEQCGEIINEWRTEKGMTREAAAELLGISPSTIRDAEHGRQFPSFRFLVKLRKQAPELFDAIFGL